MKQVTSALCVVLFPCWFESFILSERERKNRDRNVCSDYVPHGMNDSLRSNGTFQLWQLWNCDRSKHNQNQSYYRDWFSLSATRANTIHANTTITENNSRRTLKKTRELCISGTHQNKLIVIHVSHERRMIRAVSVSNELQPKRTLVSSH